MKLRLAQGGQLNSPSSFTHASFLFTSTIDTWRSLDSRIAWVCSFFDIYQPFLIPLRRKRASILKNGLK